MNKSTYIENFVKFEMFDETASDEEGREECESGAERHWAGEAGEWLFVAGE